MIQGDEAFIQDKIARAEDSRFAAKVEQDAEPPCKWCRWCGSPEVEEFDRGGLWYCSDLCKSKLDAMVNP
jgi:hypothetical protein